MRGIVTTPDYPHGTKRGYYNGCSCEECRHARQTAEKMRQHAHRNGKQLPTDLIDARPVRDHISALRKDCPGISVEAVARVAGVSAPSLDRMFYRDQPMIRRANAARV